MFATLDQPHVKGHVNIFVKGLARAIAEEVVNHARMIAAWSESSAVKAIQAVVWILSQSLSR